MLEVFDFETQRREPLDQRLVRLRRSGATASRCSTAPASRLRVVRAGAKPDEKASSERPGRRSGWIDLGRVKVSVEPGVEWRQMVREAWRLQRENFWTPNMSAVDWDAVWRPLRPADRPRGHARRVLGPDVGDAGRARHVARLRDGRRLPAGAGLLAGLPRRRLRLRRRGRLLRVHADRAGRRRGSRTPTHRSTRRASTCGPATGSSR